MKTCKQNLGKMGEDIAIGYLKRRGYKVKDRNVRLGCGEIDVVCKKNGALILVEVRSKKKGFFYLPEETVGFKKRERLMNLMDEYCEKIKFSGLCRIDVIGVTFNKSTTDAELRHYKGVT